MTARDYLKQAFTAHNRIASLREQIERLRDDMSRIKRSATQESVQASRERDPMGDLIARKMDKILKHEIQIDKWDSVLMEIQEVIDGVDDLTVCEVLTAFYIRKLDISEISKDMGYSLRYIKDLLSAGRKKIKVPLNYVENMLEYAV